jgi:hypothetical protein
MLYKSHINRNTRPTLDECSRALQSEVRRYNKVFLVIDALDECTEDDNRRVYLLRELQALQTTVNLMITSRPHITVEYELGNMKRLEVFASDDDVRIYLSNRISNTPRLARIVKRDGALQQVIIDSIAGSVKGMSVYLNELKTLPCSTAGGL